VHDAVGIAAPKLYDDSRLGTVRDNPFRSGGEEPRRKSLGVRATDKDYTPGRGRSRNLGKASTCH
jgi:hypothetical protein